MNEKVQQPEGRTYSEAITRALAPYGHEAQSLASLMAGLTGFSYEHCRKILSGRLNVSRQFNMRLAGMLNLDADGLWALLQRERVERMVGREQAEGLKTHDHDALDLLMVWQQLQGDDRRAVLRVARGLLALADPHAESADP